MRTRLLQLVVLFVFVVSPHAPLSADTYPRQPAVDVQHYAFALTLAADSPRITGEATVTVRLLAPATSVELDLVSPAGEKGMTVSAVRAGGAAMTFTHTDNRLRLPLPASAHPGQDVTYTIGYNGVPINGLHVLTNMHGERVVFSENWPDNARHWLPMIDHPYDKATGELIVTAPSHYQIVSNGLLVEETDLANGLRRTHWKQSVPIASWLYALGVAHFDVHHAGMVQGVPLETWVYPQNRDTGRSMFEETSRRAIGFFAARIGPYPYEKLANVQATVNAGGMEHATAIFYGEKGVVAGRSPVVHEIAHQWFGNAVTERDWNDVWLSEGMATYFDLLYTEEFEGRDAFVRGLERSRATVLELEKKLPDTPIVHRNLSDMTLVINDLVYEKGAWVLHMLRNTLGTETFFAGIREYYRRYRDGNASTADLRQVFEQLSQRSLEEFFGQWLMRPGAPRIEGSWRYDASTKTVEITVTQTQGGEPFQFPLDVRVGGASGDIPQTTRLVVDQTSVTGTVAVPFVPSSVTFNPSTSLLADIGAVRSR